MSNDYGFQGLSGTEIIDDILAQLKKKLAGDCSLRPHDSYNRGYSAKITYSINCYGLDQETVEGELASGSESPEPVDGGGEGELIIDQEENLSEVRDRIEDAKNDEEEGFAEQENESAEIPPVESIRQKRKYTRKLKLASPGVIGGAEDFQE